MVTGLILVDIQNDYFPGGNMELVKMNDASSNAKNLLFLFRKIQWPTFHIKHIAEHEGATFFLQNTEGAELHESIKPLPEETTIRKKFPNSFRDTRLLKELKNAGVEQVVICGAMSHMCIDATTRAAADLGYLCMVVHDACATKNLEFGGKKILAEEVHGSFMAALGSAYANVLSFNEFLSSTKRGVAT
ncbi:MAG: cysteine hydrolase [Deltaproteobacteria bacterium]|nr:cysteine hydrolase [Deltaproteobacteria bacterium]